MHRILFRLNGVAFHSYPVFLFLGIVAGIFSGAQVGGMSGIDPDAFALASLILIVPGILGARLFFVLSHWKSFAADWRGVWQRSQGGMALYGGFLAGAACSVPVLHMLRLPFWSFWDAGAISLLVMMLFGRVGCLLNGCCEGKPADAWWSLNLPDANGHWQQRIPTQLLEMALSLLLLIAAATVLRSHVLPGTTIGLVVFGYAIGRLALQELRAESGQSVAALRMTSAGLAVAGALGLAVLYG